MNQWKFKNRLIISSIVSLVVIVVILIALGLDKFKFSLIVGVIIGIVTLVISDPNIQKRDMARIKHNKEMEEERERAKNRARGAEEGKIQDREDHEIHQEDIKNAERVRDEFGNFAFGKKK